ncbi:calmin-like [Actinia tenebrosa]|uniref:Calmin-like n=1 Tax=Actinia tenebrosa TaxID=6105 RepID=A0A6P8IV02_ACTTE|nr:calmin-like [Actinia tenebrosa]
MQTSPRRRIGHESHPECAGSRICIREVDLLCPEAVESQKTFIDEREAIHKKAFRKWLNAKLQKATPPIEVKDLIEDLRDGHVLLTLMETLFSTQLPREKGKMRFHKLTNLSTALKFLEQNGVKIVGISNYDIADGISRAILGLVWSIILRFQVQGPFQETKSDVKVKDFHVEKELLGWCQDVLDG